MPPKNFADDGAVGAGGGSSSAPTEGIGGVTMNDPGPAPSPSPTGLPTTSATGDMPGQNGKMVGVNTSRGGFSRITGDEMAQLQSGGGQPLSSIYPGFSFAGGGAIPDDQGGNGTPDQTSMQDAMASVDATMQALYAKYGLSNGGNQEGDGQQTAAAMPMIPGNQSETPGPYVPQPKPQKMAAAMPMIPGNQSETPGPYVPQQPKPQQMAAAMPMIPGNQSETPGPYQPTGGGVGRPPAPPADQPPPYPRAGAIDTDEDAA